MAGPEGTEMRLSEHRYATVQSVQGPLVFVERVIEARMGEVVTIEFPDGRRGEGEQGEDGQDQPASRLEHENPPGGPSASRKLVAADGPVGCRLRRPPASSPS